MMPVVLLGGMRGGVMTPTEASAVAAALRILISAVLYRSLTPKQAYDAFLVSARSTASIGMLIAGGLVFNYVVTIENIPETVRVVLAQFALTAGNVPAVVNVILLLLTCWRGRRSSSSSFPSSFRPRRPSESTWCISGWSVLNIMLGLVTPPYGLLLFIMTNIAEVPLRDIVRDVLPFLFGMLVVLVVITFVPEVVLWLPRLLAMRDRRRIHAEAHLRAERTKSESARDPRATSMERRR